MEKKLFMKEKMSAAIMQYLDNTDVEKISDEMVRLIVSFEHAQQDQVERLQELLREAGHDC